MRSLARFVLLSLFSLQSISCDNSWDGDLLEVSQEQLPQHYERTRLRGLAGTLHSNTLGPFRDSKHLKIFGERIRNIDDGALCPSPKLKILELDLGGNDETPALTSSMFENCDNLQELVVKLDYDNPSRIDKDAFVNLTSLILFALHHQKIPQLTKDFLELPGQTLSTLVLSRCHLKEINSDAFEGLGNLEELQIINNKLLTYLPNNSFASVPKLKRLVLKHNSLYSPSWYEFHGLDFLEVLDLSGNRMANFDAEEFFKYMPRLKKLEIARNPLPCKLKLAFVGDLKKKFNHSIEVVYNLKSQQWNFCE